MRVLVIGATGLLGHVMYRELSRNNGMKVYGSMRDVKKQECFPKDLRHGFVHVNDLTDLGELTELVDDVQPDAIVNCAAASRSIWDNPEKMVALFSVLPKRLFWLSRRNGSRLIQVSSDGVFSGNRGNYSETDLPEDTSLYGLSKQLGEIVASNTVTIRTSMIGPSLEGKSGLLDWFLAQEYECNGYSRAVFSGLPTINIARVVTDILQRHPDLSGLYHVGSLPITKSEVLMLIAKRYRKKVKIIDDPGVVVDRSLCCEKLAAEIGYERQDWSSLADEMYDDHQNMIGNGCLQIKS